MRGEKKKEKGGEDEIAAVEMQKLLTLSHLHAECSPESLNAAVDFHFQARGHKKHTTITS